MKHPIDTIPLQDIKINHKYLLEITTDYTNGMLEEHEELIPSLHWFLLQSLGDYLIYLNFPVKELKKGFVIKDTWEHEHIWLEMGDGNILDPVAGRIDQFDNKIASVYYGEKPAWYEEVKEPDSPSTTA